MKLTGISRKEDVKSVLNSNNCFYGQCGVLKYIQTQSNDNVIKFCAVLNRKFGNSVKRNKIKRRLKNAIYIITNKLNCEFGLIIAFIPYKKLYQKYDFFSYLNIHKDCEKFFSEIIKAHY